MGTVNVSGTLRVDVGNQRYVSQPSGYTDDITNARGYGPGAITVTNDGTAVDLSQLTKPGYCKIQNLSDDQTVDYGIWDTVSTVFYPLCKLGPGQYHIIRLSEYLGYTFDNTGTGTSAAMTSLMVKARDQDCRVLIEAFDEAD